MGMYGYCFGCSKVHDWVSKPYLNCVPPLYVVRVRTKKGVIDIPGRYRLALFNFAPHYNVAEIFMTFMGFNSEFPSNEVWKQRRVCVGAEGDWGQFVDI